MATRAIWKIGEAAGVWLASSATFVCLWWVLADCGGWPSNDDPFYAKPLAIHSQTGHLQLVKQNGELTASSVGHLAFGWLATLRAEFSYRRLYLACIAQQAFGVAALFLTSRALSNSVGFSILASASLACFPIFFGHAFTFMTDGPAASWAVVAMCCGVLGVIYCEPLWLLAASVSIGLGYWIRQTNGVLFIAPTTAWLLAFQSGAVTQRSFWTGLAALCLPYSVAVFLLESGWLVEPSVTRAIDVAPAWNPQLLKNVAIAAYGAILLIGWFSLPWFVFAVRAAVSLVGELDGRSKLICASTAAFVTFVSFIPFVLTEGRACITNATGAFIQNAHFGPIFLSDMDEPGRWSQLGGVEWPLIVWQLLTAASIVSTAVVGWWIAWCLCASRNNHSSNVSQLLPVYAVVGLLVAIICGAALLIFFIEPHMDRYWLFVLAALGVWILVISSIYRDHNRRAPTARDRLWSLAGSVWAFGFIAFNFGLSTVFTHDMLTWNDSRWKFVNSMLDSGVHPSEIDGGRDVNAWLRLDEDPNSMPREGDNSQWWSGAAKIAISVGDRPGWHEVNRLPWDSWATGRTHFLLVLAKNEDG